jgi:hypothetical protein
MDLYLILSALLVIIGTMYLLSEINNTTSSFPVRKKKGVEYRNGLHFSLWFYKREERLMELWEEELCEDMTMTFEQFCASVYNNNFQIVYF